MLISNPYYSLIDEYIESVNKLVNNNFNCEYKCYEKEKNNYIFYNCFDLKSTIKLNSNLLLKEIKYNGTLSFTYNKKTNEVYVISVPYILCNNTKIPIFTSDIAKIIVEKLNKYTSSKNIKLTFKDPLAILAEDKNISIIIPTISDTNNHKLLIDVLNIIKSEKQKIVNDTIRF